MSLMRPSKLGSQNPIINGILEKRTLPDGRTVEVLGGTSRTYTYRASDGQTVKASRWASPESLQSMMPKPGDDPMDAYAVQALRTYPRRGTVR